MKKIKKRELGVRKCGLETRNSNPNSPFPNLNPRILSTNNYQRTTRHFTLLEMLMSVLVLTILILVMSKFYNFTVTASKRADSQIEMLESARVAFDLMATELRCIKVGESEEYPFLYSQDSDIAVSSTTDSDITYDGIGSETIAFISETPVTTSDLTSSLYEIQYKICPSIAEMRDGKSATGWLCRSLTGNTSAGWDFIEKSDETAFSTKDQFDRIIPYATNINFKFDNADPSIETTTHPSTVEIKLTLLSKDNWNKWNDLTGSAKTAFREKNEKEFTRLVHIGERI